MPIVIYGWSDDLIEIDGTLSDELNPPYGRPSSVVVRVDGAVVARVRAEFDPDGSGEWRIESAYDSVVVTRARGEGLPDDEDGCPGYSDKAVLNLDDVAPNRIAVRLDGVAS